MNPSSEIMMKLRVPILPSFPILVDVFLFDAFHSFSSHFYGRSSQIFSLFEFRILFFPQTSALGPFFLFKLCSPAFYIARQASKVYQKTLSKNNKDEQSKITPKTVWSQQHSTSQYSYNKTKNPTHPHLNICFRCCNFRYPIEHACNGCVQLPEET